MPEPQAAQGQAFSWREFATRREGLIALVLLFLITLPILTKIFTSDFGTHIAIGRQIVETRSIPEKEFLNYPSLGMTNLNGEWGFQAVLYLVYAAGGEYAVSFLCWAVVFAIYLMLHRAMTLRGANPLLAVVAIFAFSGFLRIRIQPRPELFTYLFIALTIYLFSEYFFGARKKLVYFFPALILVWANTHPTYLMGFILCGAFVADAAARAMWNRKLGWDWVRSEAMAPAVAGVLGLVLCGLNPHGYSAVLAPLHVVSRGGGQSAVLGSISELTPTKGTGMYVYYKAAAAFACVSLILGAAGRRIYLLDLFLFAIAFKGAWDSARAVSMMGLFLSSGTALHMTGFLARCSDWFSRSTQARKSPKAAAPRKGNGKKQRGRDARPDAETPSPAPFRPAGRKAIAVIAAVLVVVPLAFGATTLAFSFSQLQFGVGITEHKFSFAAADFLRRNPIPGNMFNFFDIGGFLDWQLYPQALTFIDGRTYNQQVFMEHQIVTGGMEGWQEIVRRYRINYMVLKSMDSSGMVLPIIQVLAGDPSWTLVFADGLFLVFVRNAPENEAYIRAHGLSKAKLPEQVIWEADHYIYLGVAPVVAYQTMSNMYQIMGNMPAAIDALRKAIADYDDPYLRARLRQLEEQGAGYPPVSGLPGGHPPVGSRR